MYDLIDTKKICFEDIIKLDDLNSDTIKQNNNKLTFPSYDNIYNLIKKENIYNLIKKEKEEVILEWVQHECINEYIKTNKIEFKKQLDNLDETKFTDFVKSKGLKYENILLYFKYLNKYIVESYFNMHKNIKKININTFK